MPIHLEITVELSSLPSEHDLGDHGKITIHALFGGFGFDVVHAPGKSHLRMYNVAVRGGAGVLENGTIVLTRFVLTISLNQPPVIPLS